MATARDYDVVLYGATGFVGRLTADYLCRHVPADARIALAGRRQDRLEAVRAGLGPGAQGWAIAVADAGAPADLEALAERSRVIATTVGPYSRHGGPLVEACARAGTHYADLSGEVGFGREVVDRFDTIARDSGARIVLSCGFDSIPSDLGVLALHDAVQRDGAGDLLETTLIVTALRGGVSGGTLDSMKLQLAAMRSDQVLRRLVADPYALSPDRRNEPDLADERDQRSVTHDRVLGYWRAPFVMAPYNTRVVRRSNALQGWAYGRRFRYAEVMGFPDSPVGLALATGMTVGLGAMVGGLMLGPTRAVLDRVLPAAGEGPSEKTQRNGYFRLEIHTRTSTGAHYVAAVEGRGDPGYSGSAVMFAESALSLAFDGDLLPSAAGVLTPATGIGRALIDRLRAQGFRFDVAPVGRMGR